MKEISRVVFWKQAFPKAVRATKPIDQFVIGRLSFQHSYCMLPRSEMRIHYLERGGEPVLASTMEGQVLNAQEEEHSLYHAESSGKRAEELSLQG